MPGINLRRFYPAGMVPLGILNGGAGAWAFAALAHRLSQALHVPIVPEPTSLNYVLNWDGPPASLAGRSFIPLDALAIAADKREVARAFALHGVPCPRTVLLARSEVARFLQMQPGSWVLKYPLGCAALGHRLITATTTIPAQWPEPCVVQEFITTDPPSVERLYCVDGLCFGFNSRRFPAGATPSPWIAHARGARYQHGAVAPQQAMAVGLHALQACGLDGSFGCVDLLQRPSGAWLALEVGSDGFYNHVDRDLDNAALEGEILERTAYAFWQRAGMDPPWGSQWRLPSAPQADATGMIR